jgi:hypothetical protein
MRRDVAVGEHERVAGFDLDRSRRKRKMLNYNLDGLRVRGGTRAKDKRERQDRNATDVKSHADQLRQAVT